MPSLTFHRVCIAQLYGGGPPLHVCPSLIPTPSQPLTPSFPATASSPLSTSSSSSSNTFPPPLPDKHHPATPRFLLSLLATAVFLSMPAVAAQALSAILRTVGPRTAVRYLNFAIGHGMGEREEGEPEAAVGLEGVAMLVTDEEPRDEKKRQKEEKEQEREVLEKIERLDIAGDESARTMGESDVRKEDPSDPGASDSDMELESESDSSSVSGDTEQRGEPTFFYGAVSDKVGEAAACWLARWGADILQHEEAAAAQEVEKEQGKGKGKEDKVVWSPAHGTRKRTTTAPSRFPDSGSNSVPGSTGEWKKGERELAVPRVWRTGGLSARWVRGLLSSDALFVRGEKERYDMVKAVVEMRRRGDANQEEEQEWEELFRTGIYYTNMSLEDLMAIWKDVSPCTGKPFVPLSVLQDAHWDQAVLKHRITARPTSSSSPPTSPTQRDKELGISITTAEVSALPEKDKPHYPVPVDASMRIGDSTGIEGASMDQLFDLANSTSLDASNKKAIPTCEANFFGLQQQRFPASGCASAGTGAAKWSPHPPFRFGVEFWDVDALKEKNRLHSHTVWYAGSLYNVYVQVVRKKGVQLGVYLHRQSSVDPIPPSSAPAPLLRTERDRERERGQGHNRGSSASVSTPRPPSLQGLPVPSLSRSTTPVSTPNSPALSASLPSGLASGSSTSSSTPSASHTLPATAPPVMPPQPYRDPRPAVSAYFAIACASATGASLTRFTSAPDVFSVSQSWGWKSSSLRTEEYLEVGPDGQPRSGTGALLGGREVSLRATVVLGVV
ncbi:hypothetical protein AcW2_001291 [Taiwanofungus camphoratus]|nr:hypothetical protein AcW2_001291 [Antrodia cinnamomea]